MSRHIEILHLSDFHFGGDWDPFSEQQATAAMLLSIESDLAERDAPPDLVAVTGDVAFSGQESQYETALQFFSDLSGCLGLPPSAFYFVPGNHDVDRRRQVLAFKGARAEMTSQPQVDRYLGQPDQLVALMDRQAAFRSFTEQFTAGQQLERSEDGLGYVSTVDASGVTICLVGLNSAWLSGDEREEGRLLIGERQIIRCLELALAEDPQIVVGLVHHPLGWLQEIDSTACDRRLLPSLDILLRGHLHHHGVVLSSTPQAPCLEVAAGSGHATRFYQNSYNYVTIDLSDAHCVVSPREYAPDRAQYERAVDTSASLRPKGKLPGSEDDLLAAVIYVVPAARNVAGFIAGLLTGRLNEVPVVIADAVVFCAANAVSDLASPGDVSATEDFLRLRNLLRWFGSTVPLQQRVAAHADSLERYSMRLAALQEIDPNCSDRLTVGAATPRRRAGTDGHHSWRTELLDDFVRAEDWPEVESNARNFVTSTDSVVAFEAKAALVQALLASNDRERHAEAVTLSEELVTQDPTIQHLELAAAVAETVGDNDGAFEYLRTAIATAPDNSQLRELARSIALRTGRRDFRELAEGAERD